MRSEWDANKPYNQLPLLPPAEDLETRLVMRACVSANRRLAELNRAVQLLPNPGLFVNLLPMLEAKGSSEIENIVTTTDQLFRYAGMESAADPATKEALRYRTALREGFDALATRPLSTTTAERVCSTIRGQEVRVRAGLGTMIANQATGDIVYRPPEGEDRLRTLLANWEAYLHADDGVDPLIKLGVAHYQFEAIHPFTDGNGRTGRVLNILYLISSSLLDLPVLYLSRFILKNKSEYYRLLHAVTADAAWDPWVLFMLNAVEDTAKWTLDKLDAVRDLVSATETLIRSSRPGLPAGELVPLIFELPYCRITSIVDRGVAKRQTASSYLRQLVEIGVLEELQVGREKLYLNVRLLDVMADDAHGSSSSRNDA